MDTFILDLTLLEEPAEPVILKDESGMPLNTEGQELIDTLKAVFENNPGVIALAAPQIGIKKRIFGIRFDNEIKFFINPIITKKSGLVIAPETLINLPEKEILVGRPKEITAVYYTENFKYEDNKLLDAAARIFDQMAQLLDGVLPTELGLVSDIKTDGSLYDATEDEMAEYCEFWKQYVKTKLSGYEKEIKADENASKIYKNLLFTESVINGRTEVIEDIPEDNSKLNRAQRRALDKSLKKKGNK